MDSQFLWGGPKPRPKTSEFCARSSRWWAQYAKSTNLSSSALGELHRTSSDIISLLPDPLNWSSSPRPFRGLVVGAVQSGKTASMIGVAALSLDQGYKLIVVLAGSKDDLRQQTARRFNSQLLFQRDEIQGVPGAYTLPKDINERPNGGVALPYSVDIHQWAPGFIRIRQSLKKNDPCVFVIKKNPTSLAEMRLLLGRAYDEFGESSLPTLVLDDECDDSSVDVAEATIPIAIANLWRNRDQVPVAYVGYTATAAANLLQAPENELYPEHFVYLLRYPDELDSALTVKEPNPDRWYSGSNCFYSAFGDSPGPESNFLANATVSQADISSAIEDNNSLANAIRVYILSGAYRLALQPGVSFTDVLNLPSPHTMLIQTSALMDEHERTIKGLAALWGNEPQSDGTVSLNLEKILGDLDLNKTQWQEWFSELSYTRERLYSERPSDRPNRFASWAKVCDLIPEVVRNVRIKAINSDPVVGQNLDYSLQLMEDGSKRPPTDIYVIVVGGSRLSRGITLEGLCVSYFTRWVPNPTEDTVLQISRWFGYRGTHLEFVRLFTTLGIYEALTEIHENDRDLRFQLAELMSRKQTPRNAGMVLRCSPRALPTGKLGVGRVYDLKFSPYQTVFRSVEIGSLGQKNQCAAIEFVQVVRSREAEYVNTDVGHRRGMISRGWTALEVADALDSFQYEFHNPLLAGNPAGVFHRSPDSERAGLSSLAYRSDPYQVAAYLREWTSMARDGTTAAPPLFDVGFAYGERSIDTKPFDFQLLDRTITAEGKLVGEWTGRSGGWRGDSLFDSPDPNLLVAGSSLRGIGLRGLLLLYVIHKDGTGRQQQGISRQTHTVTFGISIPSGGPEMRRIAVKPS